MASTRTNDSSRLRRYITLYLASDTTVVTPPPKDSEPSKVGVDNPIFARMLCPIEAVSEYDNDPIMYELRSIFPFHFYQYFIGQERSFKMAVSGWMLVCCRHFFGKVIRRAEILTKTTCSMGYSKGFYFSACVTDHSLRSAFDSHRRRRSRLRDTYSKGHLRRLAGSRMRTSSMQCTFIRHDNG